MIHGTLWHLLRTGGTTGTAASGKPKKVDDDPDGEKLLWGAPDTQNVVWNLGFFVISFFWTTETGFGKMGSEATRLYGAGQQDCSDL